MLSNQLTHSFKRALVTGISLNKKETLLQTIYNLKCSSARKIWEALPNRFEFINSDIKTLTQFKHDILRPMVTKGELRTGKAIDIPQFRRSGYVVIVKQAYRNRLPYTMMGLNPLPPLKRKDYIYHLLLTQELEVPYKIFKEEDHYILDGCASEIVYFIEKNEQEFDYFMREISKDRKFLSFEDDKLIQLYMDYPKRIKKIKMLKEYVKELKLEYVMANTLVMADSHRFRTEEFFRKKVNPLFTIEEKPIEEKIIEEKPLANSE